MNDLIFISSKFNEEVRVVDSNKTDSKSIQDKKDIFQDVYKVLTTQHYQKDSYTELELIDKAIEGLTLGTNDKHTTYFPPTEKE
jgi:C-terminal processing protease CtpA/Prc